MERMKTTTLLTAALALTLAACTETPTNAYPTMVFEETMADGRTVTMYGSYAYPVCDAIADAACEDGECRADFLSRCSNIESNGIIQTTNLAAWDALWVDCFEGTAALADYDGKTKIVGCEKLLPYWMAQ